MGSRFKYFTRFFPSPGRGGGSRRMLQIQGALESLPAELEVVSSQRLDYLGEDGLRRIDADLALSGPIAESPLWSEPRRHPVSRLRAIAEAWSLTVGSLDDLSLAVLDDPIYFTPLLDRLRGTGVPVVAVCHNLETLAPEQVVPDKPRTLFNKELDALSACDLVITISREETFLLRNLGIPCIFFPYYPVESIRSRLLRVREKRRATAKKGILLLGSAANAQNAQGMIRVVEFWTERFPPFASGGLIVAGYGTETLSSRTRGRPGIEFLGSLEDAALDEILSRVRACLCYQETGAGALTRICEALIAGVPVLANGHAARSYYDREGVRMFPDLDGLAEGLRRLEASDGGVLLPDPPDASELLSKLRGILRT